MAVAQSRHQLASRHELLERARRKHRRHWWELLVTFGLIAAWWSFLAPVQIGGPLTYAVVSGHSMEPDLHSGDLVVAQRKASYAVGDTLVFKVFGGYVVHNVIAIEKSVISTQGINNPSKDTWTIDKNQVLGRLLFSVPRAGDILVFLRFHPLVLGGSAALATFLLLLEYRPRKVSKRLKSVLALSKAETPIRRSLSNEVVSAAFFVLIVVSILATSIMLANGVGFFWRVALTLLGVVIATITFEVISVANAQSKNFQEPYRTLRLFSNKLHRLPVGTEIPGESVRVDSALELLRMSEITNAPVMHIFSADFSTHEFWLISDDLNYYWSLDMHQNQSN